MQPGRPGPARSADPAPPRVPQRSSRGAARARPASRRPPRLLPLAAAAPSRAEPEPRRRRSRAPSECAGRPGCGGRAGGRGARRGPDPPPRGLTSNLGSSCCNFGVPGIIDGRHHCVF